MLRLVLVSIVWAFSFSLIGEHLAGKVDSYFAVLIRVALATIVFLPFFNWKKIDPIINAKLATIGAVQIGLMYVFFYRSFLYLSVPEVLMLTIITPLYVAILGEWLELKRVTFRWLIPVALSISGATILRYQSLSNDFWVGALLVQGANLCFACGQIMFKRLHLSGNKAHTIFAAYFFGATLVALVCFLLFGDSSKIPSESKHWIVLGWLGFGASALGYYLWSTGSKQVSVTQLATMNNLVIPFGLIVNLIFWTTAIHYLAFSIGSILIVLAIILSNRTGSPKRMDA